MNSQDMQVIGLCRFSYPALGGFQVEHETIEDRRAYLYARERMEERFRIFESLTLPGLKAQTDENFRFLILIGECLPDEYQARLFDLTEDMPQAIIVPRPPMPHRAMMQEVINDAKAEAPKSLSLQFRHDDDDAVAVDFVARLRQAADDCAGMIKHNRMVGFDFNRGYSARLSDKGLEVEETVLPYYGVALAAAFKPGVKLSIMNFSHNKLHHAMPTVTYTDSPMFVRGHNDFNDSRQKTNVKSVDLKLLDAAGEAHFKDRFAIDSDQLRRAFL